MTALGLGSWLQRNWRKLILVAVATVLLHSLYLHYGEERRFALVSELLSSSSRTVEFDNTWRHPPYRVPYWITRIIGRSRGGSQRLDVKRIVFAADDPPELIDRARRVFREAAIEQASPDAEAAPPAAKE